MLGYHIPLNETVIKNKHAVTALLLLIVFALYWYDYIYSILLLVCLIVFHHRIDRERNHGVVGLDKKQTTNKLTKDSHVVPMQHDVNNKLETKVNDRNRHVVGTDDDDIVSNHLDSIAKVLPNIQDDVFDRINYNLFYNELGDQHNIQGIDDKIQGYDKRMFYT
jgi:hypothetical protein